MYVNRFAMIQREKILNYHTRTFEEFLTVSLKFLRVAEFVNKYTESVNRK